MKRIAWITLRHRPPYRSDAFAAGLESLGFTAKLQFPETRVNPQDVVVVWNLNPRYRGARELAKAAGAPLIVAENGYMPSLTDPQPCYAMALNGHNGSGFWYVGAEDRWTPLGYDLKPWVNRPNGYILIVDQRGIGSETMRSPPHFYEHIVPNLKRIFAKVDKKSVPEFKLRAHPGRHKPQRTLMQDLDGARAVVTWGSNVANIALRYGIPSFRLSPFHVNAAALSDLTLLPNPPHPDRLEAFKKLAWAQWHLSEIEDGTAFRCLLRDHL